MPTGAITIVFPWYVFGGGGVCFLGYSMYVPRIPKQVISQGDLENDLQVKPQAK